MKNFSMGNAFNEGKAFVMQNPLLYIGFIIVAQILSLLVMLLAFGGFGGMSVLMSAGSDPLAVQQMMAGAGLMFFIGMIVAVAVSLAGNFAVWRHGFSNGTRTAGEALVYGLKASLPALLFVVVGYIAIIIGAVVIGGVLGLLGAALGSTIAGLFSFIAAIVIVAGVAYLLARLSIMGPEMAVNDSLNPFAAAGRSWNATQGNGWMIALLFVVCYIVFMIVYLLAALIAGGIGGATGSAVVTGLLFIIVMLPVIAIGALIGVGLPAGVYKDLIGDAGKADIFN